MTLSHSTRAQTHAKLFMALATALTATVYAAPTPNPAPDMADAKTLDSIEVRAQAVERREQRLRHARHSGSSATIERARLEQSNVIGTEDLLKYAPNVTVRSRYIGDRNALIGGRSNSTIQGSRSLVYVDGLLISDLLGATFNPPRWGMVSASEVQSMEVLYGPFSAELPGNSMGTTIQMTTRYPRAFTTTGDLQYFSQGFTDDYGNDARYNGYRANASIGASQERWRWFLSVNRLDTTSHPMQYALPTSFITTGVAALPQVFGAQPYLDPQGVASVILGPTGIEDTQQTNAKFKLGFDLTEAATLEGVLGYWRNDYARRAESRLTDASGAAVFGGNYRLADGRGIRILDSTFSPQSGDEEHWQGALSLTWELSDIWSLQSIASKYRVGDNVLRTATTRPPAANLGGAGNVSYGDGTGWTTFDVKMQGEFTNHSLRFGAHADRYVLDTEVYAVTDWRSETPRNRRTSVFGGKGRTYAVFAEDEWRFNDTWAATFGLRQESWRAFDGVRGNATGTLNYAARSQSETSPKFGLSWAFDPAWRARLSVGKAVRFPTVSEMFQGSLSGLSIVNSDPNLQPEIGYSKEFSIETTQDQWDGRVSLFEDDIRNTLQSQTNISVTPNISNIQNIPRQRNRGIEFAGVWNASDQFNLDVSFAINNPRIVSNPNFPVSEGKRALRIPRTRATLIATYKPLEALSLSAALRHSGRQWNTLDNSDINPDTFGGTSKFNVVDLKASVRLDDDWRVGLGVDNANNEAYFVFHPYPSRTYFLELRYGQ